jgi:hypothetical protein
LRAVLTEYPAGVVAEELLERAGAQPDERQAWLCILRRMAGDGQVTVTGKRRRDEISCALVKPAQ